MLRSERPPPVQFGEVVAGRERRTEEMPVAETLIFPWQHYKHIEQ